MSDQAPDRIPVAPASRRADVETGLIAEFAEPAALVAAVRRLRELGYRALDAYTPYPVHGLDGALGLRRSRLPWLVGLGAAVGGSGAYLLQWYLNAVNFPINVGGRPLHSFPTNMIITFETAVLCAAFTAVLGVLAFAGLPRLHHPLFEHPAFLRASVDRFVLGVDAGDPCFDPAGLRTELAALGATRIEPVGGAP